MSGRADLASSAPAVDPRDRAIARVALALALTGGAFLLLRTPVLRRLAWQGARFVAFSWLPAVVVREMRAAWTSSAERPAARPAPPETGPRG